MAINSLPELVNAILGATSGGPEAGSFLFRLGIASKRTARSPHAGGPRVYYPDQERAIGWPLAGLLEGADSKATALLLAQIATALLSKSDAGQPFARDLVLVLLAPPLGESGGWEPVGEEIKLGLATIQRAELEKARLAAPQSELAASEGLPAGPGGIDSPAAQDALVSGLRTMTEIADGERRDARGRDKDAYTLLQRVLDCRAEELHQRSLNQAAADRARAEADAMAEVARKARLDNDVAQMIAFKSMVSALSETAESLRLVARSTANPDPSKGVLMKVWNDVSPEVRGLIGDIRQGAQLHALQQGGAAALAAGAQKSLPPAAPTTSSAAAQPAAPAAPTTSSAAAQPAPESPAKTPLQQAAANLFYGLLRLMKADVAWEARTVGDLVKDVQDWPLRRWHEIFVGLDPSHIAQIGSEWHAASIPQAVATLHKVAGITEI